MPFLKLDFTTTESAEFLDRRLNRHLKSLNFPSKALCTLLCMNRVQNHRSKVISEQHYSKTTSWYQSLCHIVLSGLNAISFIITFSLFLAILVDVILKTKADRYSSILLFKLQGFTCYLFGTYCCRRRVIDSELKRGLLSSSGGIGFIKRFSYIKTFGLSLFAYMLLRGIMIIITLEYALTETPGSSVKYPISGNHIVDKAVEIFGNICSVFLLLSPAVAFPLIFHCLAALVAEHSWLAVEFATDQNNYQLSVIRHYVSANQMLKNVLYTFCKHIASVWISIQLLICITVILIAAHSQTEPSTTEHWFRILALFDAMLILLCLAIISSIFNGSQSALQDRIAYMIAGDKTFSTDVYAFLASYTSCAKFDSSSLKFLWLRPLNEKFAVHIFLVVVFLTLCVFQK